MTIITACLFALTMALPFAFLSVSHKKVLPLMFLACAIHCGTVILQNENLKSVTADAHLYYFDLDLYTSRPFALGTSAVTYFTQFIKNQFGFEFIDLMALYGMLGALSILFLIKWIDQAIAGFDKKIVLALCLLPGLHFWTSAIGKDALVALSLVLILSSIMQVREKFAVFLLGSIICVAVRPHIFFMVIVSFTATNLLRDQNISRKVLTLILGIILVPLSQILFESFLGFNIFAIDDISKLINDRQNYFINASDVGVIFIDNIAVRIMYFTFSPLFYDASSAFTYVASLENFILILISVRITFTYRFIVDTFKKNGFFLLIFIVIVSLFLGLGGYNIGLALRQKVMVYPALIMLFTLGEQGLAMRRQLRRSASGRIMLSRL